MEFGICDQTFLTDYSMCLRCSRSCISSLFHCDDECGQDFLDQRRWWFLFAEHLRHIHYLSSSPGTIMFADIFSLSCEKNQFKQALNCMRHVFVNWSVLYFVRVAGGVEAGFYLGQLGFQ